MKNKIKSKKSSSLWANHQYLQIGCKLKWEKLEKTINIDFLNN